MSLFSEQENCNSIHQASWPRPLEKYLDPQAEETGAILVQIATAIRRYKSERNISLGSELTLLQLGVANSGLAHRLAEGRSDLMSITRAKTIEIVERLNRKTIPLPFEGAEISIGIL